MKKKNGFIAISVIYSFFLCFVMLMMGMLGNYLNSRLMLSKINEPPIFEQDNKLVTKILKDNTIKMPGQDGVPFIDYSIGIPLSDSSSALESGLFGNAEDDDGISYYFRGSINNNYVKFADKLWRIVRINGDGTIRLILNEPTNEIVSFNNSWDSKKYVGYTYDNNSNCTNSSPCKSNYNGTIFVNDDKIKNSSAIKDYLENTWYANISNYDNYIALATFCNDTSYGSGSTDNNNTDMTHYGAFERLKTDLVNVNPTLKCLDPMGNYGGVYKLKIGLLTADELILAGYSPNNASPPTIENWLYSIFGKSSTNIWLLSPGVGSSKSQNFYANTNRFLNGGDVNGSYSVYPVINLNADTQVSGSGTSEDPYEVI